MVPVRADTGVSRVCKTDTRCGLLASALLVLCGAQFAVAQSPELGDLLSGQQLLDPQTREADTQNVEQSFELHVNDPVDTPNRSGFELFGYFAQGVTLNPDSPNDRTNGPVLSNYRSNDYQFNALYLVAQRDVDPEVDRVQLGGRFDVLFGTDAGCSLTMGLDDRLISDSTSAFYRLAFPQTYATLFLPAGRGVHFRVGHFSSLVGNEWVQATRNFFYSHFLSWNIQPGSHLGALVGVKLTDSIDVLVGPNLGWSTVQDSNDAVSITGSVYWKSPDQRTSVYFAMLTGSQKTVITVADADVTFYSLIANQKLSDRWDFMLEHDLLYSRSRTGPARDDLEAHSLATYLFCTINEQLRAGVRVEGLRDDDGIVVGYNTSRPPAPGDYFNVTLGLNWRPCDHVRVRPEIRRDWQVRDSQAFAAAFNDGRSTNQWLFSCDVLWEF